MTELINAITLFFSTLFEAFVKSPVAFVCVLVAVFCMYLTMDNNSILNKSVASTTTEQERFRRVIMLNEEIPNKLEELRVKIGADRVVIRQFHNGRHGITGIPFTFIQTTYAATAPGKGLTDEAAWTSYPISTMSNTLNLMFKNTYLPVCVFLKRDEVSDDVYRALMSRYGVKDIIKCPLLDKNGNIVGLIVASWTETKDEERISTNLKDYQTSMNETGKNVVNKLTTINEDSDRAWWKFW